MDVQQIYDKIAPYTLLEFEKFEVIHNAIKETFSLDGSMAEVGVYKGGISFGMLLTDPSRELYYFDTFKGMPKAAEGVKEIHGEGDFGDISLEEFYENAGSVLPERITSRLIGAVGLFPATAYTPLVENETFSFVHMDGDYYQTTRDAIDFFYPRLVEGGIMVFDDWEWENCPGVKVALEESADRYGYTIEVSRPTQALIRKVFK